QTISDQTNRLWRSVALHKNPESPDKRSLLGGFARLAGSCPRIVHTKELALKAALTHYPVLLLGESGTGKELVAQSIHQASTRANQPFIAVNCSAIPDSLVESELFGYESGAFTGANREGNIGKFEAAKQGTIFLDEIGDMSLRAQAALLRVLQEKVVTPVGSTRTRPVHARVIAATHRNLLEEIKAGRFRQDLYYRLKGIQITLPPLRERTDVVELAEHLLQQMNGGNTTQAFSPEAQKLLASYDWPGNVRELQSVLIQASFLAEGRVIESEHLQLEPSVLAPESSEVLSLRDAEIAAIEKSLVASGWNVSKAAKLLKIGRNTLYRKMEEYRIANSPFGRA
ncbi:MAG: sigma-54 interaction domain-containing protein, partial [Clostridia bacterium]